MSQYSDKVKTVEEKLNNVSPSFCIAKWKQTTIHLQNGHTHSCHHPSTHKIPVAELENNPSALHNTNFKKEQRKKMLEGERPSECDYCWRVEDSGSVSDRTYKSMTAWALPSIDAITEKPWDDNVNPSYVEVSFGNVCNFKCSYCAPHISSKWMEEIEQHGAYPTSTMFNNLDWIKSQDQMPIPNRMHNPYIDAFWEWWPQLYNSLQHFRITGGEPLLSKDTFKVLDYIIEHPNKNLEVSVNTNLCVPEKNLQMFFEKVKRILGEGKVKNFLVFTSAEAKGERANYIRHGMDYNRWLDNIDTILLQLPNISVSIMSTFNALSVTSYTEFLKDVLEMRSRHLKENMNYMPIFCDIPFLRHPNHQAAMILTNDYLDIVSESVTFMYKNIIQPKWDMIGYRGFYENEVDKLQRIHQLMKSEMDKEPDENIRFKTERSDFYKFFTEHDIRRGTSFAKTFPEMTDFMNHCKKMAE